MGQKDKIIIIEDLEGRLERLPEWQKKATLEVINILETQDPSDKAMYINLRVAGHFDLADLFSAKKENVKRQ